MQTENIFTVMSNKLYTVCNMDEGRTVVRIKGTHTVYFSSSFYIINQKSVIPKTDFHCKLAMHCLFCGFVFTSQMALLFNINI